LGWSLFSYINKWIVIPIFDWLNSWVANIGLSIFLLTLIIKIGLFPLVYKSFMSSAKMRVMKPQIEAITSKYPGQENAMTRQQKTMEFYKQVGINPMSGCIPMLLQMPFLISLFMFFPTAIELRHQSFLWAPDLSTYDAVIKWSTEVPFVSQFFGNHISIFCLLMSIVNVIYTKYNMEQTGTGQEQMPGMKTMMYIMPVFMLFILNSYPAGLNYYYFISTLITILQTLIFRYFLNEEALLAKLEANKKSPAKKTSGGFKARLEEAQRKQQALLKEQQKQKNKVRR
jgi:YidC/Oxa1 family membrane protein insertase